MKEKPDIIVVGLQEYTPMPCSLIKVNNKRLNYYSKLIERAISLGTNKENYTQLMKDDYVGLALFIYVKDRFTGIIKNYEISKAGVGPFWIGNKVLCFVVTHLTPHNHNTQRRNQDFKSICERNLDQLTREVKSGKVLHGFEEGELNFLPTYKYQVGSKNEFDVSSKLPGWCDRIFYYWHHDGKEEDNEGFDVEEQSNNNNNNNQDLTGGKEPPIKLISYLSHPSYTLSDHKPVSAFFIISTLPSSHSFSSITTSFSPFKIDPNRKRKFLIGEIVSKILGFGWWLFGTYNGIKVFLLLVILEYWLYLVWINKF
ncbi:4421_t:CDS:2 [Diversispora eburnea]|uniref:4421_t:CDS:1 n=1 Tax=Diversispora eburnea TaxID=1213867 RepID=A0A9N9A8B3_9GLOM|nr:4421_t:CDS:2 [Diversispora eburnea]